MGTPPPVDASASPGPEHQLQSFELRLQRQRAWGGGRSQPCQLGTRGGMRCWVCAPASPRCHRTDVFADCLLALCSATTHSNSPRSPAGALAFGVGGLTLHPRGQALWRAACGEARAILPVLGGPGRDTVALRCPWQVLHPPRSLHPCTISTPSPVVQPRRSFLDDPYPSFLEPALAFQTVACRPWREARCSY